MNLLFETGTSSGSRQRLHAFAVASAVLPQVGDWCVEWQPTRSPRPARSLRRLGAMFGAEPTIRPVEACDQADAGACNGAGWQCPSSSTTRILSRLSHVISFEGSLRILNSRNVMSNASNAR